MTTGRHVVWVVGRGTGTGYESHVHEVLNLSDRSGCLSRRVLGLGCSTPGRKDFVVNLSFVCTPPVPCSLTWFYRRMRKYCTFDWRFVRYDPRPIARPCTLHCPNNRHHHLGFVACVLSPLSVAPLFHPVAKTIRLQNIVPSALIGTVVVRDEFPGRQADLSDTNSASREAHSGSGILYSDVCAATASEIERGSYR